MSFFKNIFSKEKKETLDKGLEKSKSSFFNKLSKAVAGKSKVDDDVLDNLEEVLVTSDVGVDTTLKVIERIEERVARDKYLGTSELNNSDFNGSQLIGLKLETSALEMAVLKHSTKVNKLFNFNLILLIGRIGMTNSIL